MCRRALTVEVRACCLRNRGSVQRVYPLPARAPASLPPWLLTMSSTEVDNNANLHHFATNYACAIATMTLFHYDFILTIPAEVRCIWRRKFSAVSVLFLLNRYLTSVYSILIAATLFLSSSAIAECPGLPMTWGTNVVGLMLGLTSTAFMSLRIYAIWNMDRRILAVVFVSGIVLPFIEVETLRLSRAVQMCNT